MNTDAARRIIADLESEARMWDDEAESAADNIARRYASIARRDKLRDLARTLPAALDAVEQEAVRQECEVMDWLDRGAGIAVGDAA